MPLDFGSHRSKLVQVLREGACSKRAHLSAAEWLRLVTWIDLNGPYHDRFINKRTERPPYDLAADVQLASSIQGVHANRCATCHQPETVSRLSLIDLRQPERSAFLAAPLAKAAGGTGKCGQAVYKDRDDADFQAVLKLVRQAVEKAWQFPRRDLESLVGTKPR